MGGFLSHLIGSVAKRRQQRKEFSSAQGYAGSLYDTIVRYYDRWPLPGRGHVWAMHLNCLRDPLFFRVGSSDGSVIEEVFVRKIYQPTIDLAGQVRQVVDLGANAGFSVRLWQNVYPDARVIAVEPDVGNCEMIRRNSDPRSSAPPIIFQGCVAATSGHVFLNRSGVECAFFMSHEKNLDTGEVPSYSMMDVLTKGESLPTIDLLKCDIEGAEKELFADCGSWINRVRTIILELHPPYSQQELMADLSKNGGDFSLEWDSTNGGFPLLFLLNRNLGNG